MKIEFDETKAAEIVAQFNLNPSVIVKWRFRKEIPAKYFESQDISEKIPRNNPVLSKIISILDISCLNESNFRTFAKRPQFVSDLKKEGSMTENEKVLFLTEVSELRNLLSLVIKQPIERNFKLILKEPRLRNVHFFSQAANSRLYQNSTLTNEEKNDLILKCKVLYNNLKVTND
jgi:hypothetical protein